MSEKTDLIAALVADAFGYRREIKRLHTALEALERALVASRQAWSENWFELEGTRERFHQTQGELNKMRQVALENDITAANYAARVKELEARVRELEEVLNKMKGKLRPTPTEEPGFSANGHGKDLSLAG